MTDKDDNKRKSKEDFFELITKKIIDLLKEDKDIHDAAVRLLNANARFKDAQAKRIKQQISKNKLNIVLK